MSFKKMAPQMSGESSKDYFMRVVAFFKSVCKRRSGESARDHFRRFDFFEFEDPACNTLINKQDFEPQGDRAYIHRQDNFWEVKKLLLQKWEDEVFNSLFRKPGEPLERWLEKVDTIILENIHMIFDERIDLEEPMDEWEYRVYKFNNFRANIKSQIEAEKKIIEVEDEVWSILARRIEDLEEEKKKFSDSVLLEAAKERAKNEAKNLVAKEALDKIREDEKEALDKKQDKAKHLLFVLFVLWPATLAGMFAMNHFDFSKISILIFIVVIVFLLWVSNKKKTIDKTKVGKTGSFLDGVFKTIKLMDKTFK